MNKNNPFKETKPIVIKITKTEPVKETLSFTFEYATPQYRLAQAVEILCEKIEPRFATIEFDSLYYIIKIKGTYHDMLVLQVLQPIVKVCQQLDLKAFVDFETKSIWVHLP